MSVIWAIGLFFSLVNHGNGIEASHQRHRKSQYISEEQPYRTGYHFQPPKNWMNGLSFSNFTLTFQTFFLIKISKFLLALTFFFLSFLLLSLSFMSFPKWSLVFFSADPNGLFSQTTYTRLHISRLMSRHMKMFINMFEVF